MHRRAARGDVDAAILHVGSIDAALLHAMRALSVQKRYANEQDVQKRRSGERDVQKRCGNERRGPAAGRCGERGGTARGAAQRNAAYRQRKAPACGDTWAPGERVRGHDALG